MNFENYDISPETREKLASAKTPEELLELAKEEGYELSDEQLESIAGGGSWEGCEEDGCSHRVSAIF